MGLFSLDHMSYEIDKGYQKAEVREPSLYEMTKAALATLKGQTATHQGFFLMIGGSRIDTSAHNNDPVAHAHEILEYHRTVELVQQFVYAHPETLVISTSSHETGGFTLGYQDDPDTYPGRFWNPEVIDRAKASTEFLTRQLYAYNTQAGKTPTQGEREEFVKAQILDQGLGITDATLEEIAYLADKDADYLKGLHFLGHAVSRRANLGWTTFGHTGVDVNLYATGDGYSNLLGNHENIAIGEAMSDYLNVDLIDITRKLQINAHEWFKPKDGQPTSRRPRARQPRSGR
ncbi:hypothetical protein BGZ97_003806 [Linnemannia gamsii]|uniref:alkaline phosphatase n=1 Tax=Linnemannia gamsii TaxID=64522 RepID=A0A9P6QWM4_9FUNG|nr:hypothetical protein BGZ97_003806 [Linnemannia gamsii]